MVYMALPYTIVLSLVGFLTIQSGLLTDTTQSFYDSGIIEHHNPDKASGGGKSH
jgi:NhaB family Na+:H+ antiporter